MEGLWTAKAVLTILLTVYVHFFVPEKSAPREFESISEVFGTIKWFWTNKNLRKFTMLYLTQYIGMSPAVFLTDIVIIKKVKSIVSAKN